MKTYQPTKREIQILNLIAIGCTRKQIARQFNISYTQCRNIVNNICLKYKAENITNCIIKAIKDGYIL